LPLNVASAATLINASTEPTATLNGA